MEEEIDEDTAERERERTELRVAFLSLSLSQVKSLPAEWRRMTNTDAERLRRRDGRTGAEERQDIKAARCS